MKWACYITRGEHWWHDSRRLVPITEADWLAYVNQDREFQPVDVYMMSITGGAPIRISDCGHWEWTDYARYHPDQVIRDARTLEEFQKAAEGQAACQFHGNCLIVRAPDAEILEKAKQVAEALNACVIGDDDEWYGRLSRWS